MQDICPTPNKNQNLHVRCLHDACKLLGGEHYLASFLGVEVKLVEDWLQGMGQPPDWVFLRCTDLIMGAAKP